MRKAKSQLRIVRRGNIFVVQIRLKTMFLRKLYWKDLSSHFLDIQPLIIKAAKANAGIEIIPKTRFSKLEDAETYCMKFLSSEIKKRYPDIEVKTFNTGIDDLYWERG